METTHSAEIDPKLLSPLALAFVGDGIYGLMVRERLVRAANRPTNSLHNASVKLVKASAQAEAAERILPLLTEEELSVYKRGRNAHVSGIPKGSSCGDYHKATGLEALFGFLYLSGRTGRMHELFSLICDT